MTRVTTSLLLIFYTDFFIESLPIKNGFSIQFKPLFKKDEYHPKTFGSLFAKISQDFTPEAILRREIFSKVIEQPAPTLGIGCTNQVARKLLLPLPPNTTSLEDNNTRPWDSTEYFNLPIIKQPFKDYKVLVATAPPDIKIGRGVDSKNVVIYVIFNEDSSANGSQDEIVLAPEIYFVNRQSDNYETGSTEKPGANSLFIVNNNRTVTGITSKHVQKILKFRNNLVNRYDYTLVP